MIRCTLVLRALGLGDLLTALPALRALRRHGRVVLLCPPQLAHLAVMIGAADATADADHRRAAPDAATWRGVPRQPELAVNLHGAGPQSHRALQALGPRRLIAHGSADAGHDGPAWDPDLHEVVRWMLLLAHHGIETRLADLRIEVEAEPHGAVVIHPGASSPARTWVHDRWVAVAAALCRRGPVVLTGSAGEREQCLAIARGAGLPEEAVLAGTGTPWQLTQVIAGASCLVAVDSGPAHVATAVGTPSALLFGPMSPARWGPVLDLDRHVVLWAGREGDTAGPLPSSGMQAIEAGQVLGAVDQLLA